MVNVAVFFGGESAEREISILTGVFVLNVLDPNRFRAVPVYIHSDGKFYSDASMHDLDVFKKKPYSFTRVLFEGRTMYRFKGEKHRLKKKIALDAAINCCHGAWGEGGGMSAFAALCKIPFASPETAASAVFLDKALTKLVCKALEIPTAEYFKIGDEDYKKRGAFFLRSVGARLGFPVVVKPASLGSSIGVVLARTEAEVKEGVEAALAMDETAIVERYVKDKADVNCAAYALRGEIVLSEPEIACVQTGIYSFSDKYVKPKKEGQKAELSPEVRGRIRAYTRTLYKRLNLKGVVRADYLVSGDEVLLSEVNTVPGSLAYYLFCDRISDARAFLSDLVCEAIERSKKQKQTPQTNALEHVSASGKRGFRI